VPSAFIFIFCDVGALMRRSNSGGHGDVERYSEEDEFEEDVGEDSQDESSDEFEDDTFEEGLDEADAQYEEVDDGNADDYDQDDFHDSPHGAEEACHDSDLEIREHLHQIPQPQKPKASRTQIAIPPAEVDRMLSLNAVSLLTLTAFDVFLLNLTYIPSIICSPFHTVLPHTLMTDPASATGDFGDLFARRKDRAFLLHPNLQAMQRSVVPCTHLVLFSTGPEKSRLISTHLRLEVSLYPVLAVQH
jgi:hypothetical protein